MEEKRNELPVLSTFDELKGPDLLRERSWWGTPTEGLLLDFAQPYTPPKWTLSHNGVKFAKRGDLHIVGGKAGHGKTAFMSQIMASLLCGNAGAMYCEIQGEPPRVLYIDTEQSIDDTIAVKLRVCNMAGLPADRPSDRFIIARLRETTSAADRYRQIIQLTWDFKPTVLFIDGMLDLVADYNSQEECSQLIRELMVVATTMNLSMWCVLHENPTTEKLVGSLGSIAQRKVTEVFTIVKHKGPHSKEPFKSKNFPLIFFEVKQTKARGKDLEDWYFTIENRANGWSMPVELGYDKPLTERTPDEIKRWITERQHNIVWPATRREVYNAIFAPEGVTDADEQQAVMEMALNRRFFLKQEKEEMMPGQKVPRLKVNDQLILPM